MGVLMRGRATRGQPVPQELVHLVGLDRGIPQRVAVHPEQGVALVQRPQRKEFHPVAPQFA